MSDPHSTTPSPAAPSTLASVSRRRTLLKGLGRAGALAGAAVPLSSLAGDKSKMWFPKTVTQKNTCTVSGQNSMVHSGQAAAADECKAYSHSYYKPKDTSGNFTRWPAGYSKTSTFQSVFNCTTTNSYRTLGWLIDRTTSTAVDETHWVVALFNASKASSTFPYTTAEVKAFCQSNDAVKRAAALKFFKDYLSTMTA